MDQLLAIAAAAEVRKMLIAVLVLALFGLWTPVAVALVLATRYLKVQDDETAAEGVEHLFCSVCGARVLTPIEQREAAMRRHPSGKELR